MKLNIENTQEFKKNPNTISTLEQEIAELLSRESAGEGLFSQADAERIKFLKETAAPEYENVLVDRKWAALPEDERVNLERKATDAHINQKLGKAA